MEVKGGLHASSVGVRKDLSGRDNKVNEPAKGTESILLVDDEKSILMIGQILLESLGYKVVATTDPNTALQLFKSDPKRFDLVISDLTMPQINGIELIMALNTIRKDTPAILMTGFRDAINQDMAREFNIKGFLLKPFVTNELYEIVRGVLDKAGDS